MIIFPAVDLKDGAAVRLVRGDFGQKTVYSLSPTEVAKGFRLSGAEYLHVVDLDGAKEGGNPNFDIVKNIVSESGLKVEVGGGIRDCAAVERYLDAGAWRVILGTAAVTDNDFLVKAVKTYGERVVVGVDISNGFVAIRGWTELSKLSVSGFFASLEKLGVANVICTDISRDGALVGTNLELYKSLVSRFNVGIVASGGIADISEITVLKHIGARGAILGKSLYEGKISLEKALEVANAD